MAKNQEKLLKLNFYPSSSYKHHFLLSKPKFLSSRLQSRLHKIQSNNFSLSNTCHFARRNASREGRIRRRFRKDANRQAGMLCAGRNFRRRETRRSR